MFADPLLVALGPLECNVVRTQKPGGFCHDGWINSPSVGGKSYSPKALVQVSFERRFLRTRAPAIGRSGSIPEVFCLLVHLPVVD